VPDLSLFYPVQPQDPRELVNVATVVRRAGLARLWIGQSLAIETFTSLAYLAARVPGLALGTAVALTPLLHPALAASSARSLAALSGKEFLAGFGVSEPSVIGKLGSRTYARPGLFAGQYVEAVRELAGGDLWRGGPDFPGAQFGLPALEAPPVRAGLGVLRSGMARAAGRDADFMVTWLVPAAFARDELAAIAGHAAEEAGRPAPRLCCVVHLMLADGEEEGRAAVATHAGAHLSRPHYRAMLEQATGVPVDASLDDAVSAVLGGGSVVAGDPATLAAGVSRFAERSMADELLLNIALPTSARSGAFVETLHQITAEWRDRE